MDHVRVPRGLELVFLERDGLLPEADFEEHDTRSFRQYVSLAAWGSLTHQERRCHGSC